MAKLIDTYYQYLLLSQLIPECKVIEEARAACVLGESAAAAVTTASLGCSTARCCHLPAADIYHPVCSESHRPGHHLQGFPSVWCRTAGALGTPLTFLISATMSGDHAAGYVTVAVLNTWAISFVEVLDRM